MRYLIFTTIILLLNSCQESTLYSGFCLPAMDSEGYGIGKWISVDGPRTPKAIEKNRRKIIHYNLDVGDVIFLDNRPLIVCDFWIDSNGFKAAIKVENHDSLVGSHAYLDDSQICW